MKDEQDLADARFLVGLASVGISWNMADMRTLTGRQRYAMSVAVDEYRQAVKRARRRH